jgi:hypothetical protein
LTHTLAGLPVVVFAFLLFGGFFNSWRGTVVNHRPFVDIEEPDVSRVLLVDDEGEPFTLQWPVELIAKLELEETVDPYPPVELPDGLFTAEKKLFQLHFVVARKGNAELVATTSPLTLAYTLLVALALLMLRNGFVSGNPLRITPNDDVRVPTQATMGVPAAPARATKRRSKKGPPPKRRSRRPR